MATPLYSFMKSKGTSFYAFPSGARDMNLFNNPNYNVYFSKVVALNIPKQVLDPINEDQHAGILNMSKFDQGPLFYNYQPGSGVYPGPIPTKFSDQLIEHLRNYVSNYDETLRVSRTSEKNDFYNVKETKNPSELIFWKWARKMNLLDLEPAEDKKDWDKNLNDFKNPNAPTSTATDYFQKYLWKEREINYYPVSSITYIGSYTFMVSVPQIMKIKNGDKFIFSGGITPFGIGDAILTGVSYDVSNVANGPFSTSFNITDTNAANTQILNNVQTYLDYNRLVVYIGEIQSNSHIQTSRYNYTEITAVMEPQEGKTPTILFDIIDNTNYYPDLEMPVLADQIQEEIVGAENLNSPIRQNPQNYPGSYYGYFDTADKTYKCSSADKNRKSGEYYGILLSNNVGLKNNGYIEKLTDFNSDNIDGVAIDFDIDHYLKMNTAGNSISNFNDFNSAVFDNQPPADFLFNALLWYYTIDDGSGNKVENLYGIEFLNNPNDDYDNVDTKGQLISTTRKSATNGNQDGTSYIYNLLIYHTNDSDLSPLTFDPTTVNSNTSMELYKNVLKANALVIDNYLQIISGFTNINSQIFEMKSLIYSQTDIEVLKQQMTNMTNLLSLYSTMQHTDSTTTKIEVDYTGVYPKLKTHVIQTEYTEIQNLKATELYQFNLYASGESFIVDVPTYHQKLLIIKNDSPNIYTQPLSLLLKNDLAYAQSFDICIDPNVSASLNTLNININYGNNAGYSEQNLLSITLPTDVETYNIINPTASTFNNAYYYDSNIIDYSTLITTGTTSGLTNVYTKNGLYKINDVIYFDNFLLVDSGNTLYNLSNAYTIVNSGTTLGKDYYVINANTQNLTLKNTIKTQYYRGVKINILRLDNDLNTSLANRYKITKTIL